MDYSPAKIWDILRNGSTDIDEELDVVSAINRLPDKQGGVALLYGQGYSMQAAMEMCGVTGNPSRYLATIQNNLVDFLNPQKGADDV